MATVIIFALIILGVIYGLFRLRKSKDGGCCSTATMEKEIKVADHNTSHYPYKTQLICDDMICDNCARHVANTLNKFEGTWAKVDLKSKKVTILSKNEPDVPTYQRALSQAGYPARLVH